MLNSLISFQFSSLSIAYFYIPIQKWSAEDQIMPLKYDRILRLIVPLVQGIKAFYNKSVLFMDLMNELKILPMPVAR